MALFCFAQQLRSSRAHKADLEASSDALKQQLAQEAQRCRDLTSDLTRTQAELLSVRDELAEAEEAKGALEMHCQQVQVRRERERERERAHKTTE